MTHWPGCGSPGNQRGQGTSGMVWPDAVFAKLNPKRGGFRVSA